MKTTLLAAWLLSLALWTSGCMSTISFKVGHDRLKPPATLREGLVGFQPLVDARPGVTNALQIGGKWTKADPIYLAGQGRPVADIVSDGLQEALTQAGYKHLTRPESGTQMVEGELLDFWLTDNWGGAVCRIAVKLRVRRGMGGEILWEKTIRAEEDDLVIIPNAMQAAMTTLLQRAVEEFASTDFAGAVAGRKQAY